MSTPYDPNTPAGAVPPVPPAPAAPDMPAAAPATPPPAPAAYPQGYPQPYAQGQPGAYPPLPPSGYGQPVPGLPPQADNRPKTLALVALILAVVGFIAACVGFTPVGLIFVISGGVLLLAAFVLSIMVLASRKQGGKGLGIAGLIVSVVGGIVFAFALVVSIFWSLWGYGMIVNEPGDNPAVSVVPDENTDQGTDAAQGTDEGTDSDQATAGDYDEDAYVAEVRPKVHAILKEAQPDLDESIIDSLYPDDTLVSVGQAVLMDYEARGDDAVTDYVGILSEDGYLTEDQAGRFVQAILTAAQDHLAD